MTIPDINWHNSHMVHFLMPSVVQRKLTTILAADAAGYSRKMETNEVRTIDELRASRDVFSKLIQRHGGRTANTAGDGLIADFPSVVEAVQCAIEVQRELADVSHGRADALQFRIGIHLGDVIVDGDDLLGEGVNLAARLQSMAKPGSVLISQQVYDQVRAKLSVGFDYLGEKRPKNYSEDVSVYRVTQGRPAQSFPLGRKDTPSKSRPRRPANQPETQPEDARNRFNRNAKVCSVILAGLLVIDLVTGAPFWMHWPALGLLTLLLLEAAGLVFPRRNVLLFARALVIIVGLVIINFLTWNGTFWALWPAGAATFLLLLWLAASSRGKD